MKDTRTGFQTIPDILLALERINLTDEEELTLLRDLADLVAQPPRNARTPCPLCGEVGDFYGERE